MAGHRLQPPPGKRLHDPHVAVDLLREEFAFVDADADEGQDRVGDILTHLIRLDAPPEIIDAVTAARESAIAVVVGDDANSGPSISFLLRSDEGPLIGYSSRSEEEAVQPLVERAARTLGYQAQLL